jgi:hypothetical protein
LHLDEWVSALYEVELLIFIHLGSYVLVVAAYLGKGREYI